VIYAREKKRIVQKKSMLFSKIYFQKYMFKNENEYKHFLIASNTKRKSFSNWFGDQLEHWMVFNRFGDRKSVMYTFKLTLVEKVFRNRLLIGASNGQLFLKGRNSNPIYKYFVK